MRASLWMSVFTGVGLLALAPGARAGEETIPAKELPEAVREAVKARFPRAEIEKAAREEEDGKTIYEVTLEEEEDRDIDVSLSADGEILEVERVLPFDDLPREVRRSLRRAFPNAKIQKVETISRGDDEVQYEVLLTAEVLLDANGKIAGAKSREDEDEDEDDDDQGRARAGKERHERDGRHDEDEDEDDDDDRR